MLFTALAHAAAGGGLPAGSALVELLIACATVGAGVGAIRVEGRYARTALIIAALCAGQGLGHLVLAVGGHHHADSATSTPVLMLAMHAAAAATLGLLIGAAEYLFVVCSSVLTWLRLFATAALHPAVATTPRQPNHIVRQAVLLRAGLGMRAPPARRALGV